MTTPRSPIIAITPAKDEAEFLPRLARSMLNQTMTPQQWVVVDDGSSDATAEIAATFAKTTPWMSVVRRQPGQRSFASKVDAFQHGYRSALDLPHQFVAVIDADLELPANYFERVVEHLSDNPACGVTGGRYRQPNGILGWANGRFVPGPAQVFRREAFADIGGFEALPFGGEDALAVVRTRMHGWTSHCLEDLVYDQLRMMGAGAKQSLVIAAYKAGRQDWNLGNLAAFQVAKLCRTATRHPILIGSLARGLGYTRSSITSDPQIDDETRCFIRAEQSQRLVRR